SSFFFTHPATTDIYTLSLHDALPISQTLQHVARHFAAQLDEMPFPLERQRALAARRRQGSLMGDARSVEGDVDDEDPRLAGACRVRPDQGRALVPPSLFGWKCHARCIL